MGCLVALCFWFFPLPVAMIVWAFDLKAPFGDYMLQAMPFFLVFPLVGAGVAELLGHKRGTNSRHR